MNVLQAIAFNQGVSLVQEFAAEAAGKLDETAATDVDRAQGKILRDLAGVLPMLKMSLTLADPAQDPVDEP